MTETQTTLRIGGIEAMDGADRAAIGAPSAAR